MNRLIFTVALLGFLVPALSYAQSDNLYMPNSSLLMIQPQQASSDSTTEATSDKEETPPNQPFSGVQPNSSSGSIEAGQQHRAYNRQYNVNRMQGWRTPDTQVRSPMETIPFAELPILGEVLFSGNFSGTYYDERNPSYIIRYGDRIGVRAWGALNYEQELTVDLLGNIFIPTVGPIHVDGVPNGSLAEVINKAIHKVYSVDYVETYISLLTPHPLSVFVTGFVDAPGRYAGGATDSILFFLDLAGGIDRYRGSYRDIELVRNNKIIAKIDLYEFIRKGHLGKIKLEEGDVIVVKERGIKVGVNGQVRQQAWFEFLSSSVTGEELMQYTMPLPGVTHVSIQGFRKRVPFKRYLSLEEFKAFAVMDDDTIEFLSDTPSDSIVVYAEGALKGRSQFFVKKGTRLHDLMNYIAVDKEYANLSAVYLRRVSVAQQQAAALADSLFRLQQNALTASSQTEGEAQIRIKEAELIDKFVERAKGLVQKGIVAIANKDKIENVYLQDADILVIPTVTDVVLITGQVIAPNTVIYEKNYKVEDYLRLAGGLGNNGDKDNILVFKMNGHVFKAEQTAIEPGDTIMVLPLYSSKNLEIAKAVTAIFYQLAVGTRAILQPLF